MALLLRRTCIPRTTQLASRRVVCLRAAASAVVPTPAEPTDVTTLLSAEPVPAAEDPDRLDRTAEATTSIDGAEELPKKQHVWPHHPKAKRVAPTPLRPGPITEAELKVLENGVLLVDKPLSWTSFDVCNKIRWMLKFLGIKKVGHAGTLDPNATGLLIVCTGRGTKFCDDFMAEDKVYSGTLRLGEGTASYDAESEVSERQPWEHITDADLEAACARFTGELMQVPPMFSAIKVGGQKMYQVAREGGHVELPPRAVRIDSLRLWRDAANPQEVHFHVACSKGTYIRSLAHDLGRALGSAAHLVALRREASGEHAVGAAWALPDLVAALTAAKEAHAARAAERAEAERAAKAAAAEAGVEAGTGAGEMELPAEAQVQAA
ncbi:hypothetical protein HYH03_002511 [Edaphochlamys debaryana]|uniref:tRNA pseudouridine(55) synthase n=1 Tax=Edaphochlamys debaryana TaxID=47281 RepID=A0A835YES2_9CHLO|nr:hypothetical protein HYH03_002511 [Edaphochlamys debaryana]|eukprot:KAG2499566.1 hypothetical protein HYH03_002511 [Edaphochlamys debaryana]